MLLPGLTRLLGTWPGRRLVETEARLRQTAPTAAASNAAARRSPPTAAKTCAATSAWSPSTDLFDASIRENLLIAAPAASQADLEAAAGTAQIHDFIAGLPEGYDTWVGETGVRVSGGQARRIAIARALLRDAPILLLDAPTEGLDAATERALMAAIQRLMAARTVFLITHRPVALAEMDQGLVLEQGRVVEQGTHQELLGAERYPRLLGLGAVVAPAAQALSWD